PDLPCLPSSRARTAGERSIRASLGLPLTTLSRGCALNPDPALGLSALAQLWTAERGLDVLRGRDECVRIGHRDLLPLLRVHLVDKRVELAARVRSLTGVDRGEDVVQLCVQAATGRVRQVVHQVDDVRDLL